MIYFSIGISDELVLAIFHAYVKLFLVFLGFLLFNSCIRIYYFIWEFPYVIGKLALNWVLNHCGCQGLKGFKKIPLVVKAIQSWILLLEKSNFLCLVSLTFRMSFPLFWSHWTFQQYYKLVPIDFSPWMNVMWVFVKLHIQLSFETLIPFISLSNLIKFHSTPKTNLWLGSVSSKALGLFKNFLTSIA